MKRLHAILLAIALAVPLHMPAQWTFHTLDVRQGISDNYVQSILKDRLGFMWFATSNRLTRYDGHHYKEYSTMPLGSYNDNVEWIAEDASGTIWLRTPVNYCFYNRTLDRMENCIAPRLDSIGLPDNPDFLTVDHDRRLWVMHGSDAVMHDFSRNSTRRFATGHGASSVRAFASRGADAWILWSDGSLQSLDRGEGRFVGVDSLPASVSGYSMMIDSDRCLWLYNEDSTFMRKYSSATKKALPDPVSGIVASEKLNVTAMTEDPEGNLWIGTDNAGILKISRADGSVARITGNPARPFSLPGNHIKCFFVDDNNVLWIGSSKNGVAYVALDAPAFDNIILPDAPDITCLLMDPSDSSVWIGTDGAGIQHLGTDFSSSHNNPCGNGRVISGMADRTGRIWWGTYGSGVFCSEDGRLTPLAGMPGINSGDTLPDFVRKITADNAGNIWIGTYRKGLFVYSPDSGISHFDVDNSPLLTNYIADIAAAPDGTMSVVTSSGLYSIDPASMRISDISMNPDGSPLMPGNSGNCLMYDSRGLLWIGTHCGVVTLETDSRKATLTDQSGRLSHPFVRAIAEDGDGRIWLSTDNGITMLAVSGHKGNYSFAAMPLTRANGISDLTFNNLAAITDSAGNPLFGGMGGLLGIKSEAFVNPRFSGQIVFTDLYVSNRSVAVGEQLSDGSVPLPANISLLDHIDMRHSTNSFAIDISTMDYASRYHPRLLYRINGGEWLQLEGNRIYFNNMSPGDYLLEVTADWPGAESHSDISTLSFTIHPPFWLTGWAWGVYSFLLLAAIAGLLLLSRRRQRRLMHTKMKELEAEKQHQMDEAKMRFFTNISHDLRTPLSLIILPVEKLLNSPEGNSIRHELGMIHSNALALLDEMNQLLDFRRLDSGQDGLSLSHGDLSSFTAAVVDQFRPAAAKAGISLEFKAGSGRIETDFDATKFRRVVMNLISNAVKYNVPGGSVCVSLSVGGPDESRIVCLTVADTGIGVAEQNRNRIFERFFQESHSDRVATGGGIGLHIVKEYASLMGGSVEYSANTPQGSVFSFSFPLEQHGDMAQDALDTGQSHDAPERNDSRKRILVVEDNADLLQFLVKSLSGRFDVLAASDGAEALATLKSEEVDMVLSDVMMPNMDGNELCRRIKTTPDFCHIPVILLTARTAEENILEGLRDGADDYIPKPFSMELLTLRINKFIELTDKRRRQFAKMDVSPAEITVSSLDEQLITKAVKTVEQHMSDESFSVEDLSAAIGMSRGHLYKKLMSITGRSPIEFIRMLRIKRGRMLLEQSGESVSRIAYECGMSPAMFAKYFKEEFGMLPSQYRREADGKSL